MRRMICFVLFGLVISNGPAFAQRQHFGRPHGRVFVVGPSFGWHPRFYPRYRYFFDPYRFSVMDFVSPVPTFQPSFVPFAPTYFFVGSQSASRPQLVFKDGTTYSVADYWRVDDQLHFITSEEGGTKSVPRTVPFADLDVQRTTDANTVQGFKFRIRDEPIEQWLQHHAQEKARSTSKRRNR
jgi:hypothetical protein